MSVRSTSAVADMQTDEPSISVAEKTTMAPSVGGDARPFDEDEQSWVSELCVYYTFNRLCSNNTLVDALKETHQQGDGQDPSQRLRGDAVGVPDPSTLLLAHTEGVPDPSQRLRGDAVGVLDQNAHTNLRQVRICCEEGGGTRRSIVVETSLEQLEWYRDYPIELLPLDGDRPFSEEEATWAQDLCRFFTRNILRDQVMPYVDGKRRLSERDMNWAAINYFPNFPVFVNDPDLGYPVALHIVHEAYTDEYKRYMFDPFKRVDDKNTRLLRAVCDGDSLFCFETTIAQLNWYRFAVRYHFIEECEKHIRAIKGHWCHVMNRRKEERKATKAITGKKAKRKPLVPRKAYGCGSTMVRGTVKVNF